MKNYLLLISLGKNSKETIDSLESIAAIVTNILPIIGTDIAKAFDVGDYGATVLFTSEKKASPLAKKISDHIYGQNSFLLLELGTEWAACNMQSKPDIWLRKHLTDQEYVGHSRSLSRG